MSTGLRVGVIGLGNIGGAIASNLIADGHHVSVLDTDPLRTGVQITWLPVRGDVDVDERDPTRRQRRDQPEQVLRVSGRDVGARHRGQHGVVVPAVAVLRGQQWAAGVHRDLDVLQRPDPVVPPGHHLEHRGVVPLGEDTEDRLPRRHHGVDLRGPGRGLGCELVELRGHLLLDPRSLGRDQGCVEAPVADLPGEVTDRREPQLGGRHDVVEHLPVGIPALRRQRLGMVQPPLQQIGDDGNVGGGTAVGEVHPVEGRTQLGRRVEIGDAVVGQRAAQLDPERLRQLLRVGVP